MTTKRNLTSALNYVYVHMFLDIDFVAGTTAKQPALILELVFMSSFLDTTDPAVGTIVGPTLTLTLT